jgi:hypothetical protein
MANIAPAAPAPAPDEAPAVKRQRLATTELERTPPKVTHTWTLEGLTLASFTGAGLNEEWDGPEFKACGLRWRLRVRPREVRDQRPTFVGVFLRLLDRTSAPVQLGDITLSVRGCDDIKITKRFCLGTKHGADPKVVRGCGRTLEHSRLASNAGTILAGGQLVLSISLRSRSFAEVLMPAPRSPLLPTLIAAALPVAGAALGGGVDVVFKAASGERVGAHSLILALRSSTLRASLWGPLAASAPSVLQPRELDMPAGMDAAVLRRVLAFMYTDELPQLEGLPLTEVHALLHAADFLDISRLREICAAELHKRLAPDNAVATLKLAHAVSCAPLLDTALRYIAANAPAVMCAPDWAELSQKQALLQAVLATMATGEPPVLIEVAPALPLSSSDADADEPAGEQAGSREGGGRNLRSRTKK